jgi:ketosteroid isomerase-like protein
MTAPDDSHMDTAFETEIRTLINRWAAAVRRHDRDGILANHDPELLMFDVPPPLRRTGIDEYSRTWDEFFAWHRPGDAFDIQDIDIVASEDVAFAAALMRCAGVDQRGRLEALDFRLTLGFRKIDGRWLFVHEHHSIPSNPG